MNQPLSSDRIDRSTEPLEVRVGYTAGRTTGPQENWPRWNAGVYQAGQLLADCCRKQHQSRADAQFCGNQRLSVIARRLIKERS
jgi:hypothetical protein